MTAIERARNLIDAPNSDALERAAVYALIAAAESLAQIAEALTTLETEAKSRMGWTT